MANAGTGAFPWTLSILDPWIILQQPTGLAVACSSTGSASCTSAVPILVNLQPLRDVRQGRGTVRVSFDGTTTTRDVTIDVDVPPFAIDDLSPTGRPQLAYDDLRDVVVSVQRRQPTWEFNATTWMKRLETNDFSADVEKLVYDRRRGVTLAVLAGTTETRE